MQTNLEWEKMSGFRRVGGGDYEGTWETFVWMNSHGVSVHINVHQIVPFKYVHCLSLMPQSGCDGGLMLWTAYVVSRECCPCYCSFQVTGPRCVPTGGQSQSRGPLLRAHYVLGSAGLLAHSITQISLLNSFTSLSHLLAFARAESSAWYSYSCPSWALG